MPTYPQRPISGQRIVITGATNGIGKEIARALVRRGAALTVVARSEEKARDTVAELATEPGVAADPEYVLADLADLSSIRAAAKDINTRYPVIDALVNNAGIHSFSPGVTTDGYELMAGTNHLGPFLLTHLLLDRMLAADAARIVVTASEAHRSAARLDIDTFAAPIRHGAIGSEPIYGRSKLLNILFTTELARRLDGTGVTVNCFCPGIVASGLVRGSRLLTGAARAASRTPLVRTPRQGAGMGIKLVLDEDLATTSGEFFTSTPGLRFLPATAARRDAALRQRLFDRTAELVDAQ